MPRNLPYMMRWEPGTHYWCSCGKSANEPLCDGSHRDSGKEPVPFEVTENK
jgi:CDGSH-type Zn-finger protein